MCGNHSDPKGVGFNISFDLVSLFLFYFYFVEFIHQNVSLLQYQLRLLQKYYQSDAGLHIRNFVYVDCSCFLNCLKFSQNVLAIVLILFL